MGVQRLGKLRPESLARKLGLRLGFLVAAQRRGTHRFRLKVSVCQLDQICAVPVTSASEPPKSKISM